jgi:hypothetical protein
VVSVKVIYVNGLIVLAGLNDLFFNEKISLEFILSINRINSFTQ